MARSKWILCTLVLVVLLFPAFFGLAVRAQDEFEDEAVTVEDEAATAAQEDAAQAAAASAAAHAADEMETFEAGLYSAADVEPASLFPEFPDHKFPIGQPIDVVLGFANRGGNTYTVDVVAGYLVSPIDPNFYIQNFTAFGYNVTVKAEEDASIRYRFRTDPRLDPREYGIRIDVFYRNEANRTFATSFFNETVQLIDTSSGFDPRSFFGYVAITGVFGLIGFVVYKLIQGKVDKSKKKLVSGKGKQQSEPAAGVSDAKQQERDWIPKDQLRFLGKKNKRTKSESSQARAYQSE